MLFRHRKKKMVRRPPAPRGTEGRGSTPHRRLVRHEKLGTRVAKWFCIWYIHIRKGNKMDKKPSMYGSPAIRVVLPTGDKRDTKWFSDASEAVAFVKDAWVEGKELSARISRDGNYYEPIYLISATGEIYVSPDFQEVLSKSPVHLGNVKQKVFL